MHACYNDHEIAQVVRISFLPRLFSLDPLGAENLWTIIDSFQSLNYLEVFDRAQDRKIATDVGCCRSPNWEKKNENERQNTVLSMTMTLLNART